MGFRFQKRIKIAPGIWINLNKSTFTGKGDGASLSIRNKYVGVNLNKNGAQYGASLPGTGISYRTSRTKNKTSNNVGAEIHQQENLELDFVPVMQEKSIVHKLWDMLVSLVTKLVVFASCLVALFLISFIIFGN